MSPKGRFTHRTLLVVGALLAPLFGAVLAPAATAVPSDAVVNVDQDAGYATIQAAISAAAPNEVIVVRPGEYAESLVIDRPLTLCSTQALGMACDGKADDTRIVSASGTGISVEADGVTIEGFTILTSAPVATPAVTVYGIDAPVTATRMNLVVRDNVIRPNPAGSHSAVPENGVRGRLQDALIENNVISGWASAIYYRPYSDGNAAIGNRFETVGTGILAYGIDHTITGNVFSGVTNQGVDIAQLASDAGSVSHGIVLRDNAFAGAPTALHVRDSVDNTVVDARLNDWGAYACGAIQAKINNEGPGSNVLYARWKGVSGPEAPIRLAGDATSGFCSIPAAIAAASAGQTILVEPGTYTGALSIGKSVTLCSAATGSETCDGSATTTILEANTFGPAVSIQAHDVTIKGFAIRGGSPLIATLGHHRATIEDNRLHVSPSSTAATHGVRLASTSGSRVTGNTITGNDYPGSHAVALFDAASAVVAENDIDRASVGIYLSETVNAFVHDNLVTQAPNQQLGGQTIGISVFGGQGASLEQNAIDGAAVGLSVGSTKDLASSYDTLTTTGVGIRVTGNVAQPSGFVLRHAELTNARTKLQVDSTVADQEIDARYNHWGVYSQEEIRETIDNGGENTVVDVSCFLDEDHSTTICPPTPSFTWTPVAPRLRQPVTFTDTSVSGGRAIVSREWDFGDGTTSTLANPTKAFTTSGNHDVTLTVVDGEGYESETSHTVTVENHAPTIPAISDKTVNEREWLAFWIHATDPDDDPLTYTLTPRPSGVSFYKGGDNSAFFGWFPSASQAGDYTLTVTASDGDLSASATFVVTVVDVNVAPLPRYNAVGVLGVDQVATFMSLSSDQDGTIVSTTWTFSDAVQLSGKTVERSFASGGIYDFTLEVVDDDGASATKTGEVHVDATPPVSSISLSGPGNAPEYSGSVQATITSTDGYGGAVRRFVIVDGVGPTEVSGPVSVNGNGLHTVEYYGIDERGNAEDAKSVQFRIDLAAPTADWVLPKNLGPFVGEVAIEVLAQDFVSGMRRVTFLVDDYEIGDVKAQEGAVFATVDGSGPRFYGTWDASGATPGLHMLSFIAEDNAGHTTRSNRSVVILPAASAPAAGLINLGAGELLP